MDTNVLGVRELCFVLLFEFFGLREFECDFFCKAFLNVLVIFGGFFLGFVGWFISKFCFLGWVFD